MGQDLRMLLPLILAICVTQGWAYVPQTPPCELECIPIDLSGVLGIRLIEADTVVSTPLIFYSLLGISST